MLLNLLVLYAPGLALLKRKLESMKLHEVVPKAPLQWGVG
jgi:hypothetical protein